MAIPLSTQEATYAAIKSGQTVFTRAKSGWMIVGPADIVKPGAQIDVTKKDGTTTRVEVYLPQEPATVRDIEYTVASFKNVYAARPVTKTTTKPKAGWSNQSKYGYSPSPSDRTDRRCILCGGPEVSPGVCYTGC